MLYRDDDVLTIPPGVFCQTGDWIKEESTDVEVVVGRQASHVNVQACRWFGGGFRSELFD